MRPSCRRNRRNDRAHQPTCRLLGDEAKRPVPDTYCSINSGVQPANCEIRRTPSRFNIARVYRQVLANRSRCKPACLDEMILVSSEQIALPALRKGPLSTVYAQHLKKEMQRGPIKPPITTYAGTLASR